MSYSRNSLMTIGGTKNILLNVSTLINQKEDVANKVTSLSSSSTDTQYPSARCVYTLIGDVESILETLLEGDTNS